MKKLYTLQVAGDSGDSWVPVIDFYANEMPAVKEAAIRLMRLAAYCNGLRIVDFDDQQPVWHEPQK